MKRDYTIAQYEALCKVIDELSREEGSVLDWFGDIFLKVKHILAHFGLYDCTADLEKYHREVLDKENMAKDQLRSTFEEISDLDVLFGGDSGFGVVVDALKSYRQCVRTLAGVGAAAYKAVLEGTQLSDVFNTGVIGIAALGPFQTLSSKLNVSSYTADTFGRVSDDFKKAYVSWYEAAHPEDARLMNQVLGDPDLTEQEKLDIRFLAYNGPEPYRKIYIEHLSRYKVNVTADQNGSWYDPNDRRIYLKDDEETFRANPRGPYNTFFHESGHAIDDFERGVNSKSRYYRYEGKSLHDYIVEDTRSYVEHYMDTDPTLKHLTPEQRREVLKSLNLTDDASFEYGGEELSDKTLNKAREKIIRYMKGDDELGGPVNEAASDVYGGVTNNAVVGGYGHRPGKNETEEEFDYWYSSDGKTTHMQESELWAEFFAAQMTHDTEALKSIERHFPRAYKAMEAMAREMAAD